MGDGITGWSDEGEACEKGYEPETMYEATAGTQSIHFMFTRRGGVAGVSVRHRGCDWCSYHINTTTEVNYYVPQGTWVLRLHVGCTPDWLFKSKVDGSLYSAIVTKAQTLEPGMIKAKKEVKGKMLQLIDVIFFNRKTKEIDYRKEIVAVDVEEAYMLAAQQYGKYNSKVHMRHANCLFSFIGDNEK